jgi:hypothetical protein
MRRTVPGRRPDCWGKQCPARHDPPPHPFAWLSVWSPLRGTLMQLSVFLAPISNRRPGKVGSTRLTQRRTWDVGSSKNPARRRARAKEKLRALPAPLRPPLQDLRAPRLRARPAAMAQRVRQHQLHNHPSGHGSLPRLRACLIPPLHIPTRKRARLPRLDQVSHPNAPTNPALRDNSGASPSSSPT